MFDKSGVPIAKTTHENAARIDKIVVGRSLDMKRKLNCDHFLQRLCQMASKKSQSESQW